MTRIKDIANAPIIRKNTDSRYRTTCKICRQGVFDNEDAEWSRQPLGICHTSCIQRVNDLHAERFGTGDIP